MSTKGKKARILLIDDDANLLKMMTLMLERAGFEMHVASNGVEGLATAESVKPDLILLDMMMPFMSGADVCRRLRDKDETSRTPIIVMSSLDRVDDKLAGFEAGADDYVTKPANPKELVARINALLARSHFGRAQIAKTIALIGAKGGVGVTSVATNLAVALEQRDHSVTLVELHPSHGSIRYHFNVQANKDFSPLLEKEPESLTRPDVEQHMVQDSSGVKLLLAPVKLPEQPLTATHVSAFLNILERDADYLIIDLPVSDEEFVHRALEFADVILLVTEPELLSVICARAQLERLKEWEFEEIVNAVAVARVPSGMLLTRLEVENEIGFGSGKPRVTSRWDAPQDRYDYRNYRGVVSVIPPAPESFQDAVRSGVPLLRVEPSSRAARALSELSEWVIEALEVPEPQNI